MANQDTKSEHGQSEHAQSGHGQFEHTHDSDALAAMIAAAPTMMQSLLDSQHDVLTASQQMVEETFSFALKRLDAQREFFASLTEAKDPDTLTRLHTAFWNRASADYAGEFKSVAQSVQGMVERLQPPKRAA
ncbi:phasin family protein [Phreatobacter stygius]|uniref:Phasin family protein n=1 Tax=Phreatobacter stygius TaxID=1940610 RepID=A0A4D7B259_9HYPH|nr:phasin family protein [Phreatobacter stygius]QCI67819.1 phasin family protein [Phreatobacter stygius]